MGKHFRRFFCIRTGPGGVPPRAPTTSSIAILSFVGGRLAMVCRLSPGAEGAVQRGWRFMHMTVRGGGLGSDESLSVLCLERSGWVRWPASELVRVPE